MKAFVVTSRRDVEVIGARKKIVHPEEITTDNLIFFIREYLQVKGHPQTFTKQQIFSLASQLISITETGDGELPITPLLIVLFIDQAIEYVASGQDIDKLPDSVPENIVKYIERLTISNSSGIDVIRAVAMLAKHSLGSEYVPQEFNRAIASEALAQAGIAHDKCDLLINLVEGGILELRKLGGVEFYRFKLDPIAEYMAALERVQTLAGDREAWGEYFAQLTKSEGFPTDIEGFLVALKVCIATYRKKFRIPDLPVPWNNP